jgi:hypothetical protein
MTAAEMVLARAGCVTAQRSKGRHGRLMQRICATSKPLIARDAVSVREVWIYAPTTHPRSPVGGSLPLAHGVSTVRYPIPERIFDYVSTVRSATAGTCDEAKFGGALLDHVVG